ncbi:NAD(P)H-dependent oxidoreductase [Halobacteriovorax sp. HLS]|uniref:NAD(P)H-dependent oxidoreductase n=1 Tax=Halobacteriovorax sp. HLS TaxID=2234000 RepID=UPI000FDABE7C|nr:NAD(P)H-dependent oxidoreductase [Halobacteriovorax sp. HLS]
MNIIEALNWRYATKEFDSTKKVSQKDLDTINESLRLTASSFGVQPWKFLVISNQEVKNSLLEHSWGQKQVVDCSHHIVMCTPLDYVDQDVDAFIESTAQARSQSVSDLEGYSKVVKNFLSYKNLEQKQQWMKDQVYIALGNLLTTCALLKIDACPMEGIIKEKYDEVLGLKEKGLTAIVACPIGYRADSDKYATAAKVRFPLEKIIEHI